MDLNDPTTVALLAAETLSTLGRAHALYGGLLTAVYGEPRETHDADMAVVDVSAAEMTQALTAAGIKAEDRDLEDARAAMHRSRTALDLPLPEDEIAILTAELPSVDVTGRWLQVRQAL